VVVAEHSKPVKGRVVEVVGHYNPTVKQNPLTINKEAIEAWLSKGVQPSNTISRLLNEYAGFDLDVKQRPARPPKKKAKEEKPADSAAAPADGQSDQADKKESGDDDKKAGEPVKEPSTEKVKAEAQPADKPAEDEKANESAAPSDKKIEPDTSDATPTDEQSGEQAGEAGK